MSLLMDALKKAEQEKREASKKLLSSDDTLQNDIEPDQTQEAVDAEETGELTVDTAAEKTYQTSSMDLALTPIEARAIPEENVENEATDVSESEPPSEDTFSEEPTLNVPREEMSLTQKTAQEAPETDTQDEKTRDLNIESADNETGEDLDQTFHGLDLEQAAASELYEDTIQGEPFKSGEIARSYDETLPGVPAAQLAKDIGSRDQPTPVAAQTVFAATQTVARPSSGLRWLLISLCLLAVGSAVVFYYYSVTPVTRDIPSPMVARGVESVIHAEDLQSVVPPDIADVTESMDITGESDPATALAETESGVVEGTISDPAQPESVEVEPVGTEEVADTATGETAPEQEAVTEPAPEQDSAPQVTATLPQVLEAPASMIRISRSVSPSSEGRLINEAYTAYQRGDYALAKSRYEQAYEQSPGNRDVLLGLAATAVRTGDNTTAFRIYSQLVRMNPQDHVARAAIMAWQRGDNIPESISLIKTMLHDAPEQPALHFSLGKLYAAQARWTEAQQAFFDAYRLDTVNPDYAFNLAISLDRMGEPASALDYYNAALQLAENNRAGFDPAAVSSRIRTIESRE